MTVYPVALTTPQKRRTNGRNGRIKVHFQFTLSSTAYLGPHTLIISWKASSVADARLNDNNDKCAYFHSAVAITFKSIVIFSEKRRSALAKWVIYELVHMALNTENTKEKLDKAHYLLSR